MSSQQNTEKPLQGWKEIAAYLERDVRTADRWERQNGLPVRRLVPGRRSTVYAYPSEIEAWRAEQPVQPATDEQPVAHWRRPATWAAFGAGVVALLLLSYGPILDPRNPVAEAAEDSMRSEQVWASDGVSTTSRLLPDGKQFLYTDWSTGNFWLKDVATGESRPVTNKGNWIDNRSYAETGAVSPDGVHIAAGWYNGDTGDYELRISGLPPPGETDNGEFFQSQPDSGGHVAAVGWLTNTQALFVGMYGRSTNRLMIADIENQTTTALKTFDWIYPDDAVVSPDRHWIAYGSPPNSDETKNDIFVLAADGSTESVVVEHPAEDLPVAWTPDGSHLLFRTTRTPGQSLWAVPIGKGKPVGPPKLISREFSGVGGIGMSPEGGLYYLKRAGSMDVYQARLDVSTGRLIEQAKKIAATVVGDNFDPLYSPDGLWIAYLSNRNFGFRYSSTRIVIRELATGDEQDLVVPFSGVRNLDWSPDSSSLLFVGRPRKGLFGVYKIGRKGGEAEFMFRAIGKDGEPSRGGYFFWMPDGRSVHYRDTYGAGAGHWIHDLESGERRKIMTAEGPGMLTLSPDGNRFAVIEHLRDEHVAYMFIHDLENGRQAELWRMDLPDGGLPPTVAAWTKDGKTILYWKLVPGKGPTVSNAELWTIPADGGEARKTELSTEALTRPVATLSLHPDGERITFSAGDPKHEVWKLSNFLPTLGASD